MASDTKFLIYKKPVHIGSHGDYIHIIYFVF